MRKPGAIPSPVNCGEIGYSCPLPLRSGSGPMPFTLFRFVPGKASTNTSEPDRAPHKRSSRETSLGMGLCVHYRSRFTWGPWPSCYPRPRFGSQGTQGRNTSPSGGARAASITPGSRSKICRAGSVSAARGLAVKHADALRARLAGLLSRCSRKEERWR
jgi:hypothetical protein